MSNVVQKYEEEVESNLFVEWEVHCEPVGDT